MTTASVALNKEMVGSQFIESINPFYESHWQSISKPLKTAVPVLVIYP